MFWIDRSRLQLPLPIRTSLALLVVACVLPGALISAYFIAANYHLHKEHLTENAIASARALASTMDRDLASIETGLRVLASSPDLAQDNLPAFYASAKAVLPYQNISNYVLLDRQGQQRLNTLRPFGAPLPTAGSTPTLQSIFETDQPVLTDIFLGPVTRRPILAMGVPVHRDGRIPYTLNVGIAPERLAAVMQKQRLPEQWILAILDSKGNIIARTKDMERYVGHPAVPELVRMAREQREGSMETLSLESIPLITAFSRSSVSSWTAAVGIPKRDLHAELRRSVLIFLPAHVLLFAMAAWIAWRYALLHVVKPAHRLRDRMNEVSSKATTQRRPAQGTSVEFLELEQGLENMAQRLRDREAERESIIHNLSNTLESISDGFYSLDRQWRFTYINQRAEEMLGLSAATMLGQVHWQTMPVHELVALRQEYEQALACGQARTLQVTVGARLLELEVHLYPSEQGLSVYCRDVTELRRMEAARQAQHEAETANQAKNEFLSRISHELRTPLNAVIGFAQILLKDSPMQLTQRQRGMIERIEMAGQHLLDMITDILDVSRAEAGNMALTMTSINTQALVQDCESMLTTQAAHAQVELNLQQARQALHVHADKTRLRQILLNLMSNAIKYNRPGGRVELLISAHDQQVSFTVQDNGIGMSEEQQRHLFEPFNRLGQELGNQPGTGIGLLISKKLIAMMGGQLTVKSSPGLGSTFAFALPRAKPGSPSVPTPAGPTQTQTMPHDRRLAVLYVEDNLANAEIMGAILAFRPQIELSFETTWHAAKQRITQDAFELILLDMHLPDGDGMTLLHWIKGESERRDTPVVVVSADATPDTISQALAAGACAYLPKPLDVQGTLRTVDAALSTNAQSPKQDRHAKTPASI